MVYCKERQDKQERNAGDEEKICQHEKGLEGLGDSLVATEKFQEKAHAFAADRGTERDDDVVCTESAGE